MITVAAVLSVCGSCEKSGVNQAGEATESQSAFADEADSLGYYLGIQLAEQIRGELDSLPNANRGDFDPEVFGRGVAAALSMPMDEHPGYGAGANQGASLQGQLAVIREVGLGVNVDAIVCGFAAGMGSDADEQGRAQEMLSQFMRPVNNHILNQKRKEFFKKNPRPVPQSEFGY